MYFELPLEAYLSAPHNKNQNRRPCDHGGAWPYNHQIYVYLRGYLRRRSHNLRASHRPRSARSTSDGDEDFLFLLHSLRRCAEYERLPGLPGHARSLAGAEPEGGRIRHVGPRWL